jgi:hypothetical protein
MGNYKRTIEDPWIRPVHEPFADFKLLLMALWNDCGTFACSQTPSPFVSLSEKADCPSSVVHPDDATPRRPLVILICIEFTGV